MSAKHNDIVKDPITLKRAPLNNELIEGLEEIRIHYKADAEELKEVENAIKYLKDVNLPIFDHEDFLSALPSLPDAIKHKIQEFVTRGSIDDLNMLKVKTPLWEFIETPAAIEGVKEDIIEVSAQGEPAK